MKLPKLPPKVSTQLAKIGFTLKKNKPEILLGLGITGFVGAIVTGCKASTKLETVNAENKARIEAVHERARKENREATGKELAGTYLVCVAQYIKLYGLSFALAVSATASLIAGNKEHREREVAAAVAYAALDKSYKKVMTGIEDRFGKDVADEIRYGVKKEVVEVPETEEKKEVNSVDHDILYKDKSLIVFDSNNKYWTKDPEYNWSWLLTRQAVANNIFQLRKTVLFENEIREMVGAPLTKRGQYFGWRWDPDNPNKVIDFGLYRVWTENAKAIMRADPRAIILDLNVEGDVLAYMTDDDWEQMSEDANRKG